MIQQTKFKNTEIGKIPEDWEVKKVGNICEIIKETYKPNFNGVCSTDIWVIDSKNNIAKDYLFYFLANQTFIDESSKSSEGTRVPMAKWEYLSKLKHGIPPYEEQKAIAKIEAGSTPDPRIETVKKIADALGVSLDELVGRKKK